MKTKMVAAATLLVSVLYVPRALGLSMAPYEKGYNITNFVEDSDLTVFGSILRRGSLIGWLKMPM